AVVHTLRDPGAPLNGSSAVALGRPVTIRAHAKINLDLRVLGTRLDGYHELRTVFQSIALHDRIDCIPRPGPFAIECDAAGVPLDGSNLVWRGARAHLGGPRGAGPGGGLGG